MGKLIKVLVNKKDGEAKSPSKAEWVYSDKIDDLQIGDANGAAFRYTPSYGAFSHEYRTDTAASDIAAAANTED